MQRNVVRQFLRLEAAGGIILFAMAVVALILSNSPFSDIYQKISKALSFWINEGLMTLFFLLVGLELKREFTYGELSKPANIILPLAAALGGMIAPSLIYLALNHDNAITLQGWSIPMATDIAFALGVLSLFGKRVPLGLKLFLMALAIVDDLGAILVIALFYSGSLSIVALLFSGLLIISLLLMNRFGVRNLGAYLLIGILLWCCVLKSGVHATVAGVLLAFIIPANMKANEKISPLKRLEDNLHHWVAYLIMPLFAFANAGLSLAGFSIQIFTDSLVLGVMLGLFLGKQLGVTIFSWLVIRLGWSRLPGSINWSELYGVVLLCGVGFTMSLFLGTLAFPSQDEYLAKVRLGVLVGSALSALFGSLVLQYALRKRALSVKR